MKIYRVSWQSLDEIEIVFEDEKFIYPKSESNSGTLYGISKKEVNKTFNKDGTNGYFSSKEKAINFRNKYIQKKIKELEKIIN